MDESPSHLRYINVSVRTPIGGDRANLVRSEGDSSDSYFHTAEVWTVQLKFHCFRPNVTPAQLSAAFFHSLNVVIVLKRKSDVTHYLDEDKKPGPFELECREFGFVLQVSCSRRSPPHLTRRSHAVQR
jgi:hypothetical protein